MKKKQWIAGSLTLALLLGMTGCGRETESKADLSSGNQSSQKQTEEETSTENAQEQAASQQTVTVQAVEGTADYDSRTYPELEEQRAVDAEELRKAIPETFAISSEISGGVSQEGDTYTITRGGEYTLTGQLKGNLVVDAGEDEVTLILADCSITSETAAPILGLQADKLNIVAQADSYNELIDARTSIASEQADTDLSEETALTETDEKTPETAGAALYSSCDLELKGHGALVIVSSYCNGIGTSDDLTMKNLTLKVTAARHAIKGNDSVTLESGQILAIAESGDGIKTEHSGLSKKGNQKGTVEIQNAIVNLYAGGDGISSAYDVVLNGDGYLGIATDTWSEYTVEREEQEGTELYLIVSVNQYADDQDYYACFNSGDGTGGKLVKSEECIQVYSGRSAYYGLVLEEPEGYDHVTFLTVNEGETPALSDDGQVDGSRMQTENQQINPAMNAYLITTMDGQDAGGDWVTLTLDSSGRNGREYSTKGIKAENEIVVDGAMTVCIRSTDDGIHVNGGSELENGETGSGSFVMKAGLVQIQTKDDGVHADETLSVQGGSLIVTDAYEGLEANQITISGGQTFAYGSDDAVNASRGNSGSAEAPQILVTGGYLEARTPSGDTDAIDSNGDYVQSGGYVLVKGGNFTGNMAGSVDVDGSITVDGGCIIACGGICEGPSGSNHAYGSSQITLDAGDYVLTDQTGEVILRFSLGEAYQGMWISCDGLQEGTAYTLARGTEEIASWIQEQGTMGNFSGGMGGFGGGMGGPGNGMGDPGRKNGQNGTGGPGGRGM